jgi:hypothetical protein
MLALGGTASRDGSLGGGTKPVGWLTGTCAVMVAGCLAGSSAGLGCSGLRAEIEGWNARGTGWLWKVFPELLANGVGWGCVGKKDDFSYFFSAAG